MFFFEVLYEVASKSNVENLPEFKKDPSDLILDPESIPAEDLEADIGSDDDLDDDSDAEEGIGDVDPNADPNVDPNAEAVPETVPEVVPDTFEPIKKYYLIQKLKNLDIKLHQLNSPNELLSIVIKFIDSFSYGSLLILADKVAQDLLNLQSKKVETV